jgi:hypothetical protein
LNDATKLANVLMMIDDCTKQDLSNLLYSHAKQTENECKKVGAHTWSQMLAAVGRTVQYANEEF